MHLQKETSATLGDSCKEIFVEAARVLYDDYVTYNKRTESNVTGYIAAPMKQFETNGIVKHDTSVRLDKSVHFSGGKTNTSRCKC
jgi:hypothetical protein